MCAVEILYACDEALRLIEAYEVPERPYVEVVPRAATTGSDSWLPGVC